MESNTNIQEKKSKKKLIIIVAAAVLVVAATAAILFVCGVFTPKKPPIENEGVVGVITDDWDPGIEEKPTGEKKQGTQIPGYSYAEMNAGDKTLNLSIGNPKENEVGMFAALKLKDGTVLYESPLLKPGQGLTEIPLSQTLEKGSYDAMVVYQCVMLDEKSTPLNAAESGFTLVVN